MPVALPTRVFVDKVLVNVWISEDSRKNSALVSSLIVLIESGLQDFGTLKVQPLFHIFLSWNFVFRYGRGMFEKVMTTFSCRSVISAPKWHSRTPTHGLASALRIRTAISTGQWQTLTAVSALLGFIYIWIHMALSLISARQLCHADWWGLTKPKQLTKVASAQVTWLYACVRYWPDRGLVFECITCFYSLIMRWSTSLKLAWWQEKIEVRPYTKGISH